MSTPLRAARTAQTFHATAPKVAVRKLHMTGQQAQSATALAFQNRMADLRKKGDRPSAPSPHTSSAPTAAFNTTRALAKPHDSSPIDFFYMPTPPADEHAAPEIGMMPILPDTPSTGRASDPRLISTDEVVRPEISVSAMDVGANAEVGGQRVVAMSESDGGSGADGAGIVGEVEQGVGEVKRVWRGFVDDLMGRHGGGLAL